MEHSYISLKKILPITSVGIFLTAIDGSIVNISLFTIGNAFHTDISDVKWIVISYLLVLSSFISIGGSLGDKFGRKITFQLGMLIFIIGSFYASLSTNLTHLIIARVIQGIGAVGIQANGLALVITYIDPKVRGRAIGINSLVVAGSLTIGPALGGFLTQFYGWPSIFLVNIPIGILGLIAVQFGLKETERRSGTRLDYLGMLLFAIMAFIFIESISLIFLGYIWAYGLLLFSVVCGYLFVLQEERHPEPMIAIRILKRKQIMFGVIAAIFTYMGINSATFLLPFYFQEIKHLSQSVTGFYMIVIPIALSLMGPPAGFLAERVNTRLQATIGAVFQALTLLALGMIFVIYNSSVGSWAILLITALIAIGIAFFTNPNGTSIMNAAEKSDLSVISGILGLSRNIGFTLGSSIAPALFAFFLNSSNKDYVHAYTQSLGYTFSIFAVFVVIGAVVSFKRGKEIIIKY